MGYRRIVFLQPLGKITNELIFPGVELEVPRMDKRDRHRLRILNGTSLAAEQSGIAGRNADADGHISAFADRIIDCTTVADIQKIMFVRQP